MENNLYTPEHFYQFLISRQEILHNRNANFPAPWTSDPILMTEKFCNIDREDDRGTRILREKIWSREDLLMEAKIFYSFAYRFCVSSETILNLRPLYRPDLAVKTIWERDFAFSWNKSIPYHIPLILKKDRIDPETNSPYPNLKWIVQKLHDNLNLITEYLETHKGSDHVTATEELTEALSSVLTKKFKFYVAQSLCDLLNYTPYLNPHGPVHLGIGAKKGIKKMKAFLEVTDQEYVEYLLKNIHPKILMFFPRGINYAVMEHGLCEYTKYCEYADGSRPLKNYFAKSQSYSC